MKNVLKILLLNLLLLTTPVFAIDWVVAPSKSGKVVYVDVDSITQFKNYYFYNIKTTKQNGEEIVITMQSQKSHPFCARLKYYTPNEYQVLNGDYENIKNNLTRSLEPVSYESRAYAAYKKVYEIMLEKNKPLITF